MSARLSILLVIAVTGCGPMFTPMTPRLTAEDQHAFDQMWDNMLTPVQRVDHQTLLDANIAYWMYTFGVDRLHMTSEKYFSNGTVMMEIDCDIANPDADQFTITVRDDRGRTLRRERYTRAEVEESSRMLYGAANGYPVSSQARVTVEAGTPTSQQATQTATQATALPVETPEQRALRVESERRRAAAAAATQPARLNQ